MFNAYFEKIDGQKDFNFLIRKDKLTTNDVAAINSHLMLSSKDASKLFVSISADVISSSDFDKFLLKIHSMNGKIEIKEETEDEYLLSILF